MRYNFFLKPIKIKQKNKLERGPVWIVKVKKTKKQGTKAKKNRLGKNIQEDEEEVWNKQRLKHDSKHELEKNEIGHRGVTVKHNNPTM